MTTITVLFVVFCGFAVIGVQSQGCHPLCSWQCDNPVCRAVCRPVCQRPVCQFCFNSTLPPVCYPLSGCSIQCPQDQCESDSCPTCATQCPNVCGARPNCYRECGQTQCAWLCEKPLNCPRPTCVLQCEQPACPLSSAAHSIPSLSYLSLFCLLFAGLWL